jgi:hypothetical protein
MTASDSARLDALEAYVDELARLVHAGGPERHLTLEEVAAHIRRAPTTVRRWMRNEAMRRRYRTELLFARDAAGRLYSTPRDLAKWQDSFRD